MRNCYHGPDDHQFRVEDVREDSVKRHQPVSNPSAQDHALAGHEVLASADPQDWRYPERSTTYNKVDEDDMSPVPYRIR